MRFDGSGARSSLPHDQLNGLFTWRTFCPEVGIGMSVPRPPIRLVDTQGVHRLVGVADPAVDKTEEVEAYARTRIDELSQLSAYVFMHNSPSCGSQGVKVYHNNTSQPTRDGRGIFARAVKQALPNLPTEDAGRLFEPVLRENFVTRAFAYAHWQSLLPDLNAGGLLEFHSRYKYLLMAHSIEAYEMADVLLSDLSGTIETVAQRYIGVLLRGLEQVATRKTHANVLVHMQGHLKNTLDGRSREDLTNAIRAYRLGEQSLLEPLALLKQHLRRSPEEYLLNQIYFRPHPSSAGVHDAP